MEKKYFVAECYRYKESGKWDYSIKGMYDDLKSAKQQFHARMAAIVKATNDFAMVIVYDSYGNRLMSDFDDSHVEPEPESEPEETEE